MKRSMMQVYVKGSNEAISTYEKAFDARLIASYKNDDGKEAMIETAYQILKERGKILVPLGKCSFSPLMTDLIDRFGARWCLFI